MKNKKSKKRELIEPLEFQYRKHIITNHKPLDIKKYRQVFDKNEVDETSIFIKSESILNEL